MNKEDYIPPYSKQFAYRVNKIKEMREQLSTAHKNDLVLARKNSSLVTVSADESKLFSGNRTFGLVRPLSVGRNRPNNNSSSNSDNIVTHLESRGKRSQSVERYRGRNGSSLNTSTSLISRNAIEFNKALQLNRDIAAEQKLRESLLQVKKEAYVKYLRAKIDHKKPSWIPSGDGAKYTESMHTSINRVGLEKSLVQKAWRRSPWPGLVTTASIQQAASLNTTTSMEINTSSDSGERDQPNSNSSGSKLSPNKRDLHIEVGRDEDSTSSFDGQQHPNLPVQASTTHQYVASSPSPSGGSRMRVRAMSYDPSPDRRTPSSPMSIGGAHHSSLNRGHSSASLLSVASNASPLRKRRASGSNLLSTVGPTHVVLTVRLINASRSVSNSKAAAGASNSYGILAVRASCSRAEFIGAIERQFGVFDQISDVSVASKYGYSGVLTFTSLSLGTLGEQVELNDSSEVNVYLGGTLYQEGDNKDFLHFLEDELTHYEGKYSSYTQYGGQSAASQTHSQTLTLQDASRSSARRRPNDQGGDRNQATTPRASSDRHPITDGDTLRVTSGRSASPRGIPTQNSSLRQAQLQQHVHSLGINRQQPDQLEAPNSPRHHPFSRPTAQLPVPYNVTHSFEGDGGEDEEEQEYAYGDDISRADTYDSAFPLDERRHGGVSYAAEEYLEKGGFDSSYPEEHTNYYHAGVRPQFGEELPLGHHFQQQQQHQPLKIEADFTIADLMPSAIKSDPLTAAQRAFLSPAGKLLTPADHGWGSAALEDLTTPMPTRSYHHPISNESGSAAEAEVEAVPTATDTGLRRAATRADAIHEKILHRVATPTYKKPSSSSTTALNAPPVTTSDYSFQSAETAQALTHSKKSRSVVAMRAPPQVRSRDEDDDTYLLSGALNAKPIVAPTVDRVAQFSYSTLLSPSLLASSFHAPRPDAHTAYSFTGSSSEETKSNVPAPSAVVPSDLVLNSYVQGILQATDSENASPEDVTPIDNEDSQRTASSRPLADVFKSALGIKDSSRGVRREGNLTIETDSPALFAGPLSSSSSRSRGSGDSDDLSSTYGSIVLSPSPSPRPLRAHAPVATQESHEGGEEDEQHLMESTLLQYLEQDRQQTPPAPTERSGESAHVPLSQQGEGPVVRSAVVTSFLEKVQQRRLAKQQTSSAQHHQQQMLSIDDLREDREVSSSGSGGGRSRPARKVPVQETFIDLADLMG